MLHENPLMADIDVDHWRNLQSLLLESAKEKRRIIVIHENGKILKFAHSAKAAVVRPISVITDAHKDAEAIYDANVATTDLVVVIERAGLGLILQGGSGCMDARRRYRRLRPSRLHADGAVSRRHRRLPRAGQL